MPYEIKQISFDTIRDYWIRTNHFHVPGKVITRLVPAVGPYQCELEDPRIIEYGLFDGDKMIGATQFQQWSKTEVRWRTINILPEYRGGNLAYKLLLTVADRDWLEIDFMIGWFRESVYPWTQKNGFRDYDEVWHEHDGDRYSMVFKPMNHVYAEIENHPEWMEDLVYV